MQVFLLFFYKKHDNEGNLLPYFEENKRLLKRKALRQ